VSDAESAASPPPPTDDAPGTAPGSPDLEEWPTHGGYLGCLMAMVFGFLLAGFLSTELISFIRTSHISAALLITSAVVVMLAGIVLFAWVGWRLGKRFYREYPAPRRRRRRSSRGDEAPAQLS
jgi:hypothetical protein